MKFKIGFSADSGKKEEVVQRHCASGYTTEPRKSVVQIHFPSRNMTLSYFNDRFDLRRGDWVFVNGKLEGHRGRVVEVSYNFKIKVSDYQRVIAVADTRVTGRMYLGGSHFIAFDTAAMPYEKVLGWFKPPASEEDVYISGEDDASFPLNDLSRMGVGSAVGERGRDYYLSNRVVYLCLEGSHGRAIVEGSEPYELEFEYRDGEVSRLTCSCFCGYPCKHEVAAMLQLKELLDAVEKHYSAEYERSDYFAAISKGAFLSFVMDGKDVGSFTMD